jgi:hypothetical protein
MTYALILNLAICGLVGLAMFFTGNAWPIFALGILLRDMPYGLMQFSTGEIPEETSRPIGFTAEVD